MMKKTKRIVLITLVVVLLALGGLAYWQKDNITSLVVSMRYSKEEIAGKIDDNKKKTENLVKEYTGESVRDFTFEEEEQIRKGILTPEEALERISNGVKDAETASAAPFDPVTKSASVSPAEGDISGYISQLYLLKAQYIGKLGDLDRRGRAEYDALEKSGKTSKAKQALAAKYIGEASRLEAECDAKVEILIADIQRALSKNGESANIIKNIRSAYAEEKILKKSYYLSAYK